MLSADTTRTDWQLKSGHFLQAKVTSSLLRLTSTKQRFALNGLVLKPSKGVIWKVLEKVSDSSSDDNNIVMIALDNEVLWLPIQARKIACGYWAPEAGLQQQVLKSKHATALIPLFVRFWRVFFSICNNLLMPLLFWLWCLRKKISSRSNYCRPQ